MSSPLIILHALAGLAGMLAFLWVAVELSRLGKPTSARVHIGAVLGVIFILFSWAMGGYYYVQTYGPQVKPLVKSAAPYAHDIGMETKEHVFLFLPFLAMLELSLLVAYARNLAPIRRQAMFLALLIFALGMLITVEGFIVSDAARAGLSMNVTSGA